MNPTYLVVLVILALLALSFLRDEKSKALYIDKKIKELDHDFESSDLKTIKLAVIEADNLLKFVLVSKGIRGRNMFDMINKLRKNKNMEKGMIRNIIKLHSLRNEIVNSLDFEIPSSYALRVYKDIRSYLKSR